MSITISMDSLAFDEVDAGQARALLWEALDDARERERAYVSLARWTWRVLVERRLDVDLRDWHRLLLDYASTLARRDPAVEPKTRGDRTAGIAANAAAERLKAFADLVSEQIRAAEASAPDELTKRAHVGEVLRALADASGEHLEREAIKNRSGLKDANLSRLLTLLAANGLVERQARGRYASFRITPQGIAAVRRSGDAEVAAPEPPMKLRIAPPAVEPQRDDLSFGDSFIQVKTLGKPRDKKRPPMDEMPSLRMGGSDTNGPASKRAATEFLRYA